MKFLLTLLILGFAVILVPLSPLKTLAPTVSGAGLPRPAPGAGDAPPYNITIKDFQFTPRNLVIPAGASVTWVNKDEEPHKLVQVDGLFTSKPLDTEDKFTFEFKSAGTFEFFCALHPRMTGKITVEAK